MLLGSAASFPLAARAQQPAGRVFRIGYLSIGSREQIALHFVKAFEEGFANGETERLPVVAAELVRLGVDVILTGFNPTTVAAMKATTTIPIVMANSIDPVSTGLSRAWRTPAGTSPGLPMMPAARFWASGLSC
jgi:putative ABC transport system substrate-binding protein